MKLADDALLGIIACVRKGLVEGVDISDLLRKIELIETPEGRLALDPKADIWKEANADADAWGD